MIKNPKVAQEVIRAAQEGSRNAAGVELPVSVKTRIGYNKNELETWLPALLECNLAAITIHARTRKEMSLVPANWDHVKRVAEMARGSGTLVIGNGDVKNRAHGLELAAQTGVDGIMIGRGVFHDLFAFAHEPQTHEPAQMLEILEGHLQRYEANGRTKPFQILKKFFKIYVNGWPGAVDLRTRLMETKNPDEVWAILAETKVLHTSEPPK